MLDALLDTLIDSLKMLPILYITYLIMELVEHKSQGRTNAIMKYSGKVGPLFGSLFGIIPQCGFSGMAATLFAGSSITLGTLVAVFIATSDEMLPILISTKVPALIIICILLCKFIAGAISGFIVDFFNKNRQQEKHADIHELCEREHCDCEGNIFISAAKHTINIILLIFVVSFILNLFFECIGNEALTNLIWNKPVIGELIVGLIGLIPNCSASVLITQLYVEEALSIGAMMAGLMVNSGVGLLVLFRMNHNIKENLKITGLTYAIGVIGGIICELLPF
ncbi:MAG: putative manganese transporter [Eubacterium sp.]